MKKYIILSLTTSAIIVGGSILTNVAFAQTTPVQTPAVAIPDTTSPDASHPRINQVEQRLNKQKSRIEAEEKAGMITEEQAKRDENRINKVEEQLKKNEAEHGGHITKDEQKQLNKEMNKTHKIEKKQKHHTLKEKREHEGSENSGQTTPSGH